MALIKEIRQRTGLAIGVIAVGLIFFLVGGDILSPNSTLLGGSSNEVGEIAGESVTYEEYLRKIEETKFSFQQSTGRTPTENEMYNIREQAWQQLVVEKAFKDQYEELGLTVSDAELVDMVQGKNIIAELRQQLVNPTTGEFDRTQLVSFLQSLETAGPEQRAFWAQQEKLFADARLRIKYDNLLSAMEYATTVEAKLDYKMANTIADVDLLFVPFYAIPDSAISVTESELKSYLSKNEAKYQSPHSVDLQYVSFEIVPSAEDSAAVQSEINRLTEEIKTTENDSVFAIRNSEGQFPFSVYLPGDGLPETLTTNVDNITMGETYGPFLTNRSSYVIHKVTDVFEGTPRMRASHILFSAEGLEESEKESVRQEAQNILEEIQNGLNFTAAATQYGQDGTAQSGGDLGWFAQENFIAEFADVVFSTKNIGLINRLVETEYGFHIIEVTALPLTQTHKIATVEVELIPSDATRNEVFRSADYFAASTSNSIEFVENAKEGGYSIQQAQSISPFSRNINNLQNAREVIRWAFNDAKIGNVSTVYELDQAYVVALLTNRSEEGAATLDQVRSQILVQVRNEKKAAHIAKQFQGKSNLEEMRAVFPNEASVNNIPDLRMNASVLPGVGFAPRTIGAIFGLKNSGEITKPIKEDIGVLVAKLNSLTPSSEIADYTNYQNQRAMNASQRSAYMVMMALEDLANVKDYRYKFF